MEPVVTTSRPALSANRWWRLIPVVFITYSLAYLDRANFAFGMAGGMAKDLGITTSTSSLLGSLFFLGYFFFQIPGVYYATKGSARRMIFISLLLWGGLAMATGIISNVHWLMVIRFLLGVVEGVVLPSMVVLLSRWFTRTERSRANSFLILGNPVTILWMSIASGYLVHSLGWRWMFIWEGLPAIIWAFCWRRLIADHPENATWLPAAENQQLRTAIQLEQQAIPPVRNYLAAFKSRKVLLLSLLYALWSIGVYGFVLWLPTIIKAAPGMDIITTGWLSAFPYLLAIIGMLAASGFSDRTGNRKIVVWPCLLLAAVTFYLSYLTGAHHFWLSFALLSLAGMAMYAPYGPFFALITEILPANVAGGAIALINSFGSLGSFAGAYLVGYFNGATGHFDASYIFMSAALFLSAIAAAFLRLQTK
jgi:sugar phosphate permease